MDVIFEALFFFIPFLGLAAIPLGLAVMAIDRLLYSSWVPVMRARMGEQKWPAAIMAMAPLLSLLAVEMFEDHLPARLVSMLTAPWPFVFGCIASVAFSACWLKLPPDDDGEVEEPPARNLTAEWLLSIIILGGNYIGVRVISGGW